MKNFTNYITNTVPDNPDNRTDEFLILGTLLATAVIAQATSEIMNSKAMQGANNLANAFFNYQAAKWQKKTDSVFKDPDKRNGDSHYTDNDEKETNNNSSENEESKLNDTKKSNMLLALATKVNENAEDSDEKKQNSSILKLLSACSYDKDGNEIPFEQRNDRLKEIMPGDQYKELRESAAKKYDELSKDKKIIEELEKSTKEYDPKDLEEYTKKAQETAKATWKTIEDNKNSENPKPLEELDLMKELLGALKTKEEPKEESKEEPKEEPKEESKGESKEEPKGESKGESKEEPKEEPKEESKGESKEEPKTNKDGEIEKEEEITDPETGKKTKVITHTGPRGGKYYYPEGKPKTDENKVYLENYSLSSYLKSKMI